MRFRNKKVLVTGGAGFVGSNLVNQLVKEGAVVTVLDDLFTGRKENIAFLKEIKFVEGSVTDYDLVAELVKKSEIVFNLAVRNIIVSTSSPLLDFQVNGGGTFNVLLAAKNYGVERVVYTSSASVYGNPRYLPINEDDHLSTLNPYAASKLSGESYSSAFYESYGVPVVILRYSNVYGINQSPLNPYCGVISKFFDRIMNGQAPHIHGDGEQTRDFIHVNDISEAIKLTIKKKITNETFNIGSGTPTKINDLANLIIKLTNLNRKPIYTKPKPGDIKHSYADTSKAKRLLGFKPKINLKEGLKNLIQNLQENKTYIENLKTKNPNFKIQKLSEIL